MTNNAMEDFQDSIVPPPLENFDGDDYLLSLQPHKGLLCRPRKCLKQVKISKGNSVSFEMQDGSVHELEKASFWMDPPITNRYGTVSFMVRPISKKMFKKFAFNIYKEQKNEKWNEQYFKAELDELNARLKYLAAPSARFVYKIIDKLAPYFTKYGLFDIMQDCKDSGYIGLVIGIVKIILIKRKDIQSKWFFVSQQEIKGPFSRSEIIQKIVSQEINGDTPIWNSEMPKNKWLSLKYTPMRYCIPTQK